MNLLRDFSLNSLSFSQIHFLFRKLSMNSSSNSWFLFEITFFFANSLSVPRIQLESIFYFVILLWIHYLFREFPMNSQSTSRFLFYFIKFFANTPWIHFIPQNHYEFTISFAISLWIHYLFREFTLNPLFFCGTTMYSLWNHYETTMKSLLINHLLYDFTRNSSSFSPIHYWFPEFPLNSLVSAKSL